MLVARVGGGGSEVGGGRSAEWGEEARLADAGWQSEVRKRGRWMQGGRVGEGSSSQRMVVWASILYYKVFCF